MTMPRGLRSASELSRNQGLMMLIHDWSLDPVLFDRPALKDQVHAAQVAALEALDQGVPRAAVVRQFVDDSGLYQAFSESIGMRSVRPPRSSP